MFQIKVIDKNEAGVLCTTHFYVPHTFPVIITISEFIKWNKVNVLERVREFFLIYWYYSMPHYTVILHVLLNLIFSFTSTFNNNNNQSINQSINQSTYLLTYLPTYLPTHPPMCVCTRARVCVFLEVYTEQLKTSWTYIQITKVPYCQ